MFNLWFHTFCFVGFVYFFLFKILIVDSFFSIIPIILSLFLSLLPCIGGIFILKIDIFHIFHFIIRSAELRSGENFSRLFLWLLAFPDNCIASENDRAWPIGTTRFLWTMWIFWFTVVSWPVTRRFSVPVLWIKVLRSRGFLVFARLWELSAHRIFSFKYYIREFIIVQPISNLKNL